MLQHTRRRLVALAGVILLVGSSACGGSSGGSSAATTEPSTVTTEVTTTAPPTTEATTTTLSMKDRVGDWADETGFNDKAVYLTTAASVGIGAAIDAEDIDMLAAACQVAHGANEDVLATLPSPWDELDVAIEAMVEDWDAAMHLCTRALEENNADLFGQMGPAIQAAQAHIEEINALLDSIGWGATSDTVSGEVPDEMQAFADSIGCTDVTMGAPIGSALATGVCTFQGEHVMVSIYTAAPAAMETVAYCTAETEGQMLAMVVGPTWIVVAGASAVELLTTIIDVLGKDDLSVTILSC